MSTAWSAITRACKARKAILNGATIPKNVGAKTLSTAKGTLHSPRNVHKPRSPENLCDGGSRGTVQTYTGLRAISLEQCSVQESRCCLLSTDGRVALSAEQVHRKPETEDMQVAKDTEHHSNEFVTPSQWQQDMTDIHN